MKKWLVVLVLAVLALLGWIGAGPFLTIHAIRGAIQAQDAAELSEHVDVPAVRTSLKQQIDDYVVRRAGADAQSSLLGSIGLRMASGATSGLVDAAATPLGLAAVLEGRNFWHRLDGSRESPQAPYSAAGPRDPLEGASYRYESPSRFTATILNADGDPVVFVLTRRGLDWKVSDVRLPL
jgi:hypothetical protein